MALVDDHKTVQTVDCISFIYIVYFITQNSFGEIKCYFYYILHELSDTALSFIVLQEYYKWILK